MYFKDAKAKIAKAEQQARAKEAADAKAIAVAKQQAPRAKRDAKAKIDKAAPVSAKQKEEAKAWFKPLRSQKRNFRTLPHSYNRAKAKAAAEAAKKKPELLIQLAFLLLSILVTQQLGKWVKRMVECLSLHLQPNNYGNG